MSDLWAGRPLPLGLVGLTFVGARPQASRRRLLMIAMAICVLGFSATVIAMYLPIFAMSGAVTG